MPRLTFPPALAVLAGLLAGPAALASIPPAHFQECATPTAASASVLLPAASTTGLEAGDEVAIFTPTGTCAGAAVWTGDALAIPVWADDPMTESEEGFTAGQQLSFRVWQSSTNSEIANAEAIRVEFDEAFDASGVFTTDAIYLVDAITVQMVTSTEDAPVTEFALDANYPNPFRSETTIRFALPVSSHVTIEIFDVTGRRVSTLLDEQRVAGRHEAVLHSDGLPSGTYFYRLRTEAGVAQRRMTLIK